MEKLPQAVTYEIAKHLNFWQIMNFLTTCRKFYKMCKSNEFWTALLKYHYHVQSSAGFRSKNTFKSRAILNICAGLRVPWPSKIKKFGHFLWFDVAEKTRILIDTTKPKQTLYCSIICHYKPIILLYPIVVIFTRDPKVRGAECYISFNVETREYYGVKRCRISYRSGYARKLEQKDIIEKLSSDICYQENNILTYSDSTNTITFDWAKDEISVKKLLWGKMCF